MKVYREYSPEQKMVDAKTGLEIISINSYLHGVYAVVEVKGVKREEFEPNTYGKVLLTLTGVGISRKSEKDSWDIEKGVKIAEGRAYKALETKFKGKPINKPFMG